MPAVGKYTVAQELSKLIGYKVFHNHLTFDTVHSILEEKDDFFWECVRKMRFDCLLFANKKDVNLIMTSCYDGPVSDEFFKPLIRLLKREKIRLSFVHLVSSEKSLLMRAKDKSRKEHLKLLCSAELK